MRATLYSFSMFVRQIAKDSMLFAVLFAPILAGLAFHFGIPYAETALCGFFGKSQVLAGYYLLFDLFLAVMTPYMVCFASSMVMLTERDENMAAYLAVTPVGKRGYIVSRLALPAAISVLFSIPIVSFFSLTVWNAASLLVVCALSGFLGVSISLLLFSLSHNRVEGMALAKLSGVVLLGLPVPFFLFSGVQYLFSPLPSFWIAKLCLEHNLLHAVPALLTSLLWIWALYGRFEKKLS